MNKNINQDNNNGEKVLVTSALPYPNGPLHIGHVSGVHLPSDIYYRFVKLQGKVALMICGTDDHGVGIEIAAKKEQLTEEEITWKYKKMIEDSLKGIDIYYDYFGKTHSAVHSILAQNFFTRLQENGYVDKLLHDQMYCNDCEQFLPDRYIEGVCPKCSTGGARGDQCEACGSLLDPVELVEPFCKMCGGHNVDIKETYQYFFKLSLFEDKLRKWLDTKKDWKENVKRTSINKWLTEGLNDRSISRDIKWGIPIPGDSDKKMYVWFEAPIGYISFLQEYAKSIGQENLWESFWSENSDSRVVHFIGKDNIVFHTIIWPAMLLAMGDYKLPTDVPGNEFVNLEDKKISTSRNHAVWLHEMLEKFPSDVIRFYLTFCIPENKDSNFSWKEFVEKNNELSNTLGNLVNRTLVFSRDKLDGEYGEINNDLNTPEDDDFISNFNVILKDYESELEKYSFKKALKILISLFSEGNRYFNSRKPWALVKEDIEQGKNVINIMINYLLKLAIVMEPFLPDTSRKIKVMLGVDADFIFDDIYNNSINISGNLEEILPLFNRLNIDHIKDELEKLGLQ